MIVAFDIDDTITRHPEFFSFMSHRLIEGGHTVIIITFREDRQETSELLSELDVVFTRLITSNLDVQLEHGVFEWKAMVCREHGVELFFEDDASVLQHVDDATLCLMPIDKDAHDLSALVNTYSG